MMKTNFHTHTTRCMHAVGTDREYVQAAIDGGFQVLGISDHGPYPYGEDFTSKCRMKLGQVDEYRAAIKQLQTEFQGKITLYTGFEYEYFPQMESWMRDMLAEKKINYILLGNHFAESEKGTVFARCETAADLRSYTDLTIRGMETGMYAYLCHPDLAISYYTQWDADAKAMCRALCQAAKACQMPLEYNLYGVYRYHTNFFHGLGYPYTPFWEMAAQEGCTAIIGVDAHNPQRLESRDYEDAVETLNQLGMKRTDSIRLQYV